MASSTVVVVANVYCQTGRTENMLSILRKLTDTTRTESGCMQYELHQNLSDETHFTFIEQWTNEEALQLHFQTDHFKQASEDVKAILAKPIEILKCKKLL